MPHVPKEAFTRMTVGGLACTIATALLVTGCGGSNSVTTQTSLQTGVLAPNTIFYSNSPDGGVTTVLNQVNPDGTGRLTLGSLPQGYQGIAMNPAVISMKVFGYSPSGPNPAKYGIYTNNAVSGAGAKMIVPPTYSFIESLQVSFDGKWVYYVAPIGNADPVLYKVSITGGAPTVLDNTGFIYSENVDVVTGSMVTYDKEIAGTGGIPVSAIFVLPTSGQGSPTMLANDPSHNYEFPQFSKDASQIVFECDKDNPNFEVYVMSSSGGSVSGSNLTQVTNMPSVAKEDGVSFSADGMSAAFIGSDSVSTQAGVYRTGTIGANPPASANLIVQDPTVQSGLYWTSASGRSQGGTTAYLSGRRHSGLTP